MSSFNRSDRVYGRKALKLNEITNGEFTIVRDFCRDNDFIGHYNLMCSVVEKNKLEEGWLFGHHKVVKVSVLEELQSVIVENKGKLKKIKELFSIS